jgi:hypothetical protein
MEDDGEQFTQLFGFEIVNDGFVTLAGQQQMEEKTQIT